MERLHESPDLLMDAGSRGADTAPRYAASQDAHLWRRDHLSCQRLWDRTAAMSSVATGAPPTL